LSEEFRCDFKESEVRGYTDYIYNARLSRVSMERVDFPSQTVLFGEGTSSDARYAKAALPQSFVDDRDSPARRHYQHKSATINGANYAFSDGHVKWIEPQHISVAPAKIGVWTFSIR
jgi:prepilin-type processing-associated H-X9-DG protein